MCSLGVRIVLTVAHLILSGIVRCATSDVRCACFDARIRVQAKTTLQLACRVRPVSIILPVTRLPLPPSTVAAQCLQLKAFCSEKTPRSKVKVCKSVDSKDGPSKGKGKGDDGDAGTKGKPSQCCSSKKDKDVDAKDKDTDVKGEDAGGKGKDAVCHDSHKTFSKQAAEEEEEDSEYSETSSSSESEGSEEEESKTPAKDCEEDEMSEHSEEEDPKRKAASEMCDCVKAAVAKAVTDKGKDLGKPSTPKSIDKPGKSSPKEGKPKVSEHVGCCKIERSKSASGGESGTKQCKSFKKDPTTTRKDQPSEGEGTGKETGAGGHEKNKNQTCECIKQALDQCKKGTPTKPRPDKGNEDKPKGEKPKEEKPKGETPDDAGKKPGGKPSTGKKGPCEKKKRPVVKCR